MFFIIKNKLIRNNKVNKRTNIRILLFTNRFLKGVKIISIDPITLLIKKRG